MDGLHGDHFDLGATFVHRQQPCRVVAAVAVEQGAGVACLQAQYADQVRNGILGQRQLVAHDKLVGDMDPGHAHAVASSMASRVTCASSCSCSSSTQYGGIQ